MREVRAHVSELLFDFHVNQINYYARRTQTSQYIQISKR